MGGGVGFPGSNKLRWYFCEPCTGILGVLRRWGMLVTTLLFRLGQDYQITILGGKITNILICYHFISSQVA